MVRFSINQRTRSSEEMITDSMAKFGSSKTITGEDIRELGEELLNLRRSSEEKGTGERRAEGLERG